MQVFYLFTKYARITQCEIQNVVVITLRYLCDNNMVERINKTNENTNTGTNTPALNRHEKRQAQKKQMVFGIIVFFEALILIGVISLFVHYYSRLRNRDFLDEDKTAKTENTQGTTEGSVNVNNDKFTLTCYKVQLVRDIDGNPAALIYFTFVNKTATPLSMSDVFPPSVKQGDYDCETFAVLEDAPDELYNRELQISDGQQIECCYAVKLHDTMDTLVLTIHDNFETFTDIGSVEIPLSNAVSPSSEGEGTN